MNTPPLISNATPTTSRSRRHSWITLLLVVALLLMLYTQLGLYSIQPIGALPEGITVLVWRRNNEPFFNSPDGTCLRVQGGVSLLCRMVAMGTAPTERIILRLPYQEWAYLASTDGQMFGQ